MYIQHANAVLETCNLREDQQVLLPSGRAARVVEFKPSSVRFRYLDSTVADELELSRFQVGALVRI